jgi:hypothetical protein
LTRRRGKLYYRFRLMQPGNCSELLPQTEHAIDNTVKAVKSTAANVSERRDLGETRLLPQVVYAPENAHHHTNDNNTQIVCVLA